MGDYKPVSVEPVGWHTEDHLDDKSATTYSAEVAQRWRDKGWPVWPLYAAPAVQGEPFGFLYNDGEFVAARDDAGRARICMRGAIALFAAPQSAVQGRPVAYISHTSEGDILGWERQFDAPSHTPLYTALIDTCDHGHKFAKLDDHPGNSCVHCLRSAFAGARAEVERLRAVQEEEVMNSTLTKAEREHLLHALSCIESDLPEHWSVMKKLVI